jgi:hypothetical protein
LRTGTAGFSGDATLSNAAKLAERSRWTIDQSGVLLILDLLNNLLRHVPRVGVAKLSVTRVPCSVRLQWRPPTSTERIDQVPASCIANLHEFTLPIGVDSMLGS